MAEFPCCHLGMIPRIRIVIPVTSRKAIIIHSDVMKEKKHVEPHVDRSNTIFQIGLWSGFWLEHVRTHPENLMSLGSLEILGNRQQCETHL